MPKRNAEELKYNNIVPIIGIIIALVVNVGAIFWWGGTMTQEIKQVIANQMDQKDMWLKIEGRLGKVELSQAQTDVFHQEVKNILHIQ